MKLFKKWAPHVWKAIFSRNRIGGQVEIRKFFTCSISGWNFPRAQFFGQLGPIPDRLREVVRPEDFHSSALLLSPALGSNSLHLQANYRLMVSSTIACVHEAALESRPSSMLWRAMDPMEIASARSISPAVWWSPSGSKSHSMHDLLGVKRTCSAKMVRIIGYEGRKINDIMLIYWLENKIWPCSSSQTLEPLCQIERRDHKTKAIRFGCKKIREKRSTEKHSNDSILVEKHF